MIRRTYDTRLVRKILSDKKLKRRVVKNIPIEAYDPENQKDIIYLLVSVDEVPIGVIVFHTFSNPICCQGHVNYLPKYWGTGLVKHTVEAIEWVFNNTICQKIVALIPDRYPEIVKHAEKSGMVKEGYLRDSIMINNKLEGQTLVGIEKVIKDDI